MKINNSMGPNISSIESGKTKPTENAVGDKKTNTKSSQDIFGSSQVNLSERAQMMSKAKEIAKNAPDVDEAKIARLQKMIDEGKYSINASAVADKLVDEQLLYPTE